jgi:hypothetical protein
MFRSSLGREPQEDAKAPLSGVRCRLNPIWTFLCKAHLMSSEKDSGNVSHSCDYGSVDPLACDNVEEYKHHVYSSWRSPVFRRSGGSEMSTKPNVTVSFSSSLCCGVSLRLCG